MSVAPPPRMHQSQVWLGPLKPTPLIAHRQELALGVYQLACTTQHTDSGNVAHDDTASPAWRAVSLCLAPHGVLSSSRPRLHRPTGYLSMDALGGSAGCRRTVASGLTWWLCRREGRALVDHRLARTARLRRSRRRVGDASFIAPFHALHCIPLKDCDCIKAFTAWSDRICLYDISNRH